MEDRNIQIPELEMEEVLSREIDENDPDIDAIPKEAAEDDISEESQEDDHGRALRDRIMRERTGDRDRREKLDAGEEYRQRWFALVKMLAKHQMVSGKVETILPGEKGICFATSYNGFQVLIPFEEFFLHEPVDKSNYELETQEGRVRYLKNVKAFAVKFLGARISFLLTKAENPDFSTCSGYYVEGSRKIEREAMQKYNFYNHPDRKNPDQVCWMIQREDIVSAQVLGVWEDHLWVDAQGVDSLVYYYNWRTGANNNKLTYRYFSDLRKGYSTGDDIRLMVTNIVERGDGDYSLRLSGLAVEKAEIKEKNGRIPIGTVTNAVYMGTNDKEGGFLEVVAYSEELGSPVYITDINPGASLRTQMPGDMITIQVTKISQNTGRIMARMARYRMRTPER